MCRITSQAQSDVYDPAFNRRQWVQSTKLRNVLSPHIVNTSVRVIQSDLLKRAGEKGVVHQFEIASS